MITLGKIQNFLSEEEINWFLWYWSILPKKIDTGQRNRSMTYFNVPFFHRICKKLDQKVKLNSPHEEITTVNINDDYLPGGVHSDGYIEYDSNDDISLTYLIPLKTEKDSNYSTVIFNEKSKKAVSLNHENGLGNSGLVTYPQIKKLEVTEKENDFDKEIYKKYLSHLKYESLAGLTLLEVQHWELGSAMVWPRENLHCSANFAAKSPRMSLLITTRKNNE
jgi:hypothetical protein